MYSVKILKDSLAPCGKRLTTWELTYPRMVHADLMTHRLFSRNAASSRAIPSGKYISGVIEDPAMPMWWGKNQSGMQAKEELDEAKKREARALWLEARDAAVEYARKLNLLGLHKQVTNRILEPWWFITVILSATEFDQWFHQRNHPDAQPEIKWVAERMQRLYADNVPTSLSAGEWHLPLVNQEDVASLNGDVSLLKKVSVGRCARVSYLTHEGKRDLDADIALHDRMRDSNPGHWSPFEHVAMALDTPEQSGNFFGWRQYRKEFHDEHHGSPRR